jgi:spermidine synthase
VGVHRWTRIATGATEGVALTRAAERMSSEPVVIERVQTPRGELVLRRDGDDVEVISNGTFLMDSRDGRSERLLVSAALAPYDRPIRMLLAGLGVGTSLVEALSDSRVEEIVVVELEPAVVQWHHTHLRSRTGAALDDPRVTVIVDDLAALMRTDETRYDVICLDVDNGPDWTVTEANAALYSDSATALLSSRLHSDGTLAVWSANRAPDYEAVLGHHLTRVETHEVTVARGEPDVIMVATGPRGRG